MPCLGEKLPVPSPQATASQPTAPARPERATVEQAAYRVLLEMKLPGSAPKIGPDPSSNEWNMAIVGHPLWLWTGDPAAKSATLTRYGATFTLHATRTHVTFDMGDGTTVTCTEMTPYGPTTEPGTPSPTCGHTYDRPSLPRGSYYVTATTHWSVNWAALGYTGTLPATTSHSVSIPVGELHALVNR